MSPVHVAGGGAALWHSQAVIGAAMHQPKTELPTSTELIVSICQYADTANYRYCSPNWLLLSTVGLVVLGWPNEAAEYKKCSCVLVLLCVNCVFVSEMIFLSGIVPITGAAPR